MSDPAGAAGAAGVVGVRELRQNLSVYLRRVAAGETLRVTERGAPVALLAPLPQRAGILARLVAAGRATAARGDLLAVTPVESPKGSVSLTQALEEQRAER
ncbi:MAG TPA: type II toxin-antitoxin system prevent-host-death family antitoxin [Chloroflexota bacterium]|nr:type II toxin-antitoxin system prevent-host-death family antitoxin [Chloroflexota bacterium]